jgi:branched-chain amino acid transport system ATP-binding protein
MNSADTILKINRLTKRFGGLVAVDDLSFDINRGGLVGLIGPNGSGKTTVFNCIMGVHTPTSGEIIFNDIDITNMKRHKIVNHGLARISQHSNPIDVMTLAENIRLHTQANSILSFNSGADYDKIYSLGQRVGIEDQLDERPDSVPYSSVRKLELAKALATDPQLLLIDEPFAGLNAEETEEVSKIIQKLSNEDITIIIVDHNMHGLMPIVDEVVTLHGGKKLAQGTPDEIVANEEVQKAYLGGTEGI